MYNALGSFTYFPKPQNPIKFKRKFKMEKIDLIILLRCYIDFNNSLLIKMNLSDVNSLR